MFTFLHGRLYRCGCKKIAAFICHIYCREMKNDGNKFQLRKKHIFQLLFNKTLISLVLLTCNQVKERFLALYSTQSIRGKVDLEIRSKQINLKKIAGVCSQRPF